MGVYKARELFDLTTVQRHIQRQICLRCGQEKTLEAFQAHPKSGKPITFCKVCMQEMRQATMEAKGMDKRGRIVNPPKPPAAPAPTVAEEPARTPVPVTELGTITADTMHKAIELLNMLEEAKAEIMTVRQWAELAVEASAILSGADLFVFSNGRVWLRRPGGSGVNESIELATVLALAGVREGVVFF